MTRADYSHFTPLTVQWGDMDALGHVNNTVYFRYTESGRIAYFDALSVGLTEEAGDGQGPILADIQCTFLGQLRHPAQITVGTRTSQIGRKSLIIDAEIFRDDEAEPIATSRAVVVWFDYVAQQSAPIPDDFRQRILDFEVVTPQL